MPDLWAVKRTYIPLAEPFGVEPAIADGSSFAFVPGEPLEIDEAKTETQEKEGVLIRKWLFLNSNSRSGYVPFNETTPDDPRSIAIAFDPDIPKREPFHLFQERISVELFIESCVQKALRWNTNAAYLYALAFVESGSQWPAGKISSPKASPGEIAFGTFKFRPATWKVLVEKLGKDEHISADHALFPQPQLTFAASQAGEIAAKFEADSGEAARYVDLYLAHLFTYEGAKQILAAAKDNPDQKHDTVTSGLFGPTTDEHATRALADLNARKRGLLLEGGEPVTLEKLVKNFVAELDRGFEQIGPVEKLVAPDKPNPKGDDAVSDGPPAGDETLGSLSEEFESRGNPAAIGFDRTGGWSYGKYQIASKKSFNKFMAFVGGNFPEIHAVLKAAGGVAAARAGANGFKSAWRGLVSRADFVPCQHGFIKATHYDPMVSKLASKIDILNQPLAIRNVVWSVAVQHGPGSSIVKKVINSSNKSNPEALINDVYRERSRVNVYFRRSTPAVRQSVKNRFTKERKVALTMLRRELSA